MRYFQFLIILKNYSVTFVKFSIIIELWGDKGRIYGHHKNADNKHYRPDKNIEMWTTDSHDPNYQSNYWKTE